MSSSTSILRLAVIGFGGRATQVSRLMCKLDPQVRLVAIADTQIDAVPARLKDGFPDVEKIRLYGDADELLEHADGYDALLIATRCNTHTPLAVKAAQTKLPLFLEKPVAISWEQLRSLKGAYAGREGSVLVSFPLRLTAHVTSALEILRSGRIGTINQMQAVNNVSYGGVYFGQWYRDYQLTGGLWLQKATHDFDYITQLMNACPTQISAMHTRRIYGGMMPAGLTCATCSVTETCRESPQNLRARGDDGGIMPDYKNPAADHACAFATDIRHQDAGSAMILYDNGAHASYSQNFVPRRKAGRRGVTIIGYDGTVTFDWYTDRLTVIDHHRDKVEEIDVKASGGHGGGDERLVRNFIDLVRGRDVSHCPLTDGLLSAAMCLSARDAAVTRTWQAIPAFGARQPAKYAAPEVEPV